MRQRQTCCVDEYTMHSQHCGANVILQVDEQGLSREVAKLAELWWFHSIVKQSKLAEHWKDAHWVGKLKRADEWLLVIKGLTRSARAGRRQARDEKWNLDSVEAVLNSIQELKASTELDKQKNITNQFLDERSRAPLCKRCA